MSLHAQYWQSSDLQSILASDGFQDRSLNSVWQDREGTQIYLVSSTENSAEIVWNYGQVSRRIPKLYTQWIDRHGILQDLPDFAKSTGKLSIDNQSGYFTLVTGQGDAAVVRVSHMTSSGWLYEQSGDVGFFPDYIRANDYSVLIIMSPDRNHKSVPNCLILNILPDGSLVRHAVISLDAYVISGSPFANAYLCFSMPRIFVPINELYILQGNRLQEKISIGRYRYTDLYFFLRDKISVVEQALGRP